MSTIETQLKVYLEKRKENQTFRTLYTNSNLIDFSSNDYLGLANSAWVKQEIYKDLATNYRYAKSGATGSRLLSGNSELYEELEKQLADFHHAESALLFNSGYNANLGLIATVARKNDLILFDELAHASILQALKISEATNQKFTHNDLIHLQELLETNQNKYNQIFIITESLFSMDGDFAPLKDLALLSDKFNANLIIDEAHATGIYGKNGAGKCIELGIEKLCFARVYTFGKAIGAHGAVVVGSELLKNYLINFSKPFIYSTALSLYDLLHIKHNYLFIQQFNFASNNLHNNIKYFKENISVHQNIPKIIGEGPIFAYIIEHSEICRAKAKQLQSKGLDIKPIVYPTVAKGKERLRIIIHSFNTKEQIDRLIHSIL